MPHIVKRIAKGNTAKVNAYAGPAGELVMDTTTNDLVLETGTAGGVRMAKASTAIAATNGVEITAGGTLGQNTTVSGVSASTSAPGVVQLNNATDSTAQNQAATPKAVSDALQAAKDYADTAAGAAYTGTAPISVDANTHVISAADATVAAKGVVQLNNATDSTAQNQAATPKAVSDALQAAKDYADTAAGAPYTGAAPISVDANTREISVATASTTVKGVMQVGDNMTVNGGVVSVKPWTDYAADHTTVDPMTLQEDAIVVTDESIGYPTAVLAEIEQTLSGSASVVPSSFAVRPEVMAHAAMPSNKYIEVALSLSSGSGSATYTAPADGYIIAYGTGSATGVLTVEASCLIDGVRVSGNKWTYTVGSQASGYASCPVPAGAECRFGYNKANVAASAYFVYCLGTAPAA